MKTILIPFLLAAVTVGGDWGGERTPMTKDVKGNCTAAAQLRPTNFSCWFSVDGMKTNWREYLAETLPLLFR
ncbi:MAG: hypothetical protein JNK48_26015 [Bryobacterales bacterium]|nr:hypothetical protein [Bryobacterales bacterium]